MTKPAWSCTLREFTTERRVKVPARTFQLLARSSRSTRHTSILNSQQHEYHTNNFQPLHSSPNHAHNHEKPDTTSLADAVKENMRAVKYPVSIITSTDPRIDPSGGYKSWKGATVASFNTVSMYPIPIVSFNMHHLSSTLQAIKNSGYFAVHILNHSPNAAYLADLFSRPKTTSPFEKARSEHPLMLQSKSKWHFPRHKHGMLSNPHLLPPRLQISATPFQSRAVMFHMLCHIATEQPVPAGDHMIVIGKVIRLLSAKGIMSYLDPDLAPGDMGNPRQEDNLTYQHGHYSVTKDDIRHPRAKSIWTFGPETVIWRSVKNPDTPSETLSKGDGDADQKSATDTKAAKSASASDTSERGTDKPHLRVKSEPA